MRRKTLLALFILIGSLTVPACSSSSHTVKAVKPKKHWFPYDQKKHRKRKRTKIIRMKS